MAIANARVHPIYSYSAVKHLWRSVRATNNRCLYLTAQLEFIHQNGRDGSMTIANTLVHRINSVANVTMEIHHSPDLSRAFIQKFPLLY